MKPRHAAVACLALLLAACSSMTTIQSPNPGTMLQLEDKALALPGSTKLDDTTFGHVAFRATERDAPSVPPFYGILPLALHKGRLVAGIVLTAPLMLLTKLRGAFKFYEIDARTQTIRYRDDASGPWITYQVKPDEKARARDWFESRAAKEAGEKAAAPVATPTP